MDRLDRYRARLAPVLDHVRENLHDDLDVDSLARIVHFSPYHFHRVFRSVMGETVGVFVRRARLERAVRLMKAAPERGVGPIALDAGFRSFSDFSRTFRRHYWLAPSTWDRRSPLTFREGAGDRDRPALDDLRALVEADEGPPVTVRLETVPAATLAYVRIPRPFEERALDEGYRRLRGHLQEIGLPRPDGALLGLSWDDMEVTPPDRIRYDLAVPVPEGVPARDGVQLRRFPALRIAVAPARGDLARVARVWDHLYHDWLPRSQWEPYNLPAFERYRTWPETLETDRGDLDACIPLVKLRG